MKRVWINQPSAHQPLHRYHATNVLVDIKDYTIYFTSGDVISMMVPKNVLSEGWL